MARLLSLITAATSLPVKQKTLNLPVWSHGRFAPRPSMKRLRSSFSTTISRRRTNVISQDLTPIYFPLQ